MKSVHQIEPCGQIPVANTALVAMREDERKSRVQEARVLLTKQKIDAAEKRSAAAAEVSPFNFGEHPVRVVVREGEPWFVCSDVAETLGYRDSHNAARHLDADEKGTQIVSTPGGDQKLTIINESGLYALVLRSRKPEARKFAKWVTSEVLPQIRKTGAYLPKEFAVNPGDVLTKEQQDALRQLVKTTADRLPKAKQGPASIKMWSKLKAHFGVAYRDIPQQEFTEAVSLLTRAATEWGLVDDEGPVPSVDVEKLLLSGQADLVPLPDDVMRAVDRKTWELTQEAHGLIHMHLQKRVAYVAVGGYPERRLDRDRAIEALNRGKLGDALAHLVLEKTRNALSYAQIGVTAMNELQDYLTNGIAQMEGRHA